ncbi:MAG: zinc metallopeptidase [Verrucomicrobiales bacterium]
MDPLYIIIIGGSMLLSHLVGVMLRRRFNEYSQMALPFSGREVAERMLAQNGIRDVKVISTPGALTDHYNPADKTVNLSQPVYHLNSVAAAAVAAHECGHAVQHATAYPMLAMRSSLVPVVQLGSNLAPWLLMAGIAGLAAGGGTTLLLAGIILFSATTIFALVTLPVEFDASRRALVWLEQSGVATGLSHEKAKNALFWAAMTYTVAALASIGQLLYYVLIFLQARSNDR